MTSRRTWFMVAACASCAVAVPSESDLSCPAGDSACLRPEATGEYYWSHQKGDVNRTGLSPYLAPKDLHKGPTWRWVDPHLDVISQSPLIDDRLNIYINTRGGRVYKFGPDGAQRWMYRTTRGLIGTVPAAMDGRLYANTQSGYVFALDMESGELVWEVKVAAGVTGPDSACLLAVNGTIISATDAPNDRVGGNGVVVALDTEGRRRWTFSLEPFKTYNFQASSPGDGTVVFQDSAGGVYRLRIDTGERVWQSGIMDRQVKYFTTGAAVVGPNGVVYAASNTLTGGVIHAYRLDDGALVWRRDIDMWANQAVAVGPLAGTDGRLAVVAGVGANPGFPPVVALVVLGIAPGLIFVAMLLDCCLLKCCKSRCCGGLLRFALPFLPLLAVVLLTLTSDEFTPAERPLAEPAVVNSVKIVFIIILYIRGLIRWQWWCGRPGRPIRICLCPVALISGVLAILIAIHILSTACGGHPSWLWHSQELPSGLMAFDAETGASIWTYTPPPFKRLSSMGDEANLLPRVAKLIMEDPVGDLICLPDSWSQAVIDASGTVFVGFMDGHMYVVRDEDGDGKITGSEAVAVDFQNSFQGTQAIAPGMLVVVPCGGGMHVWRS